MFLIFLNVLSIGISTLTGVTDFMSIEIADNFVETCSKSHSAENANKLSRSHGFS